MSDDLSPEFQSELLDDFYAECDELLGNIREQLTRLEHGLAKSETDRAALEALFRSTHSIKGNAAIVGLRAAEGLAHATEGLLRRLSRGETTLRNAELDLLAAAMHRLEQIITTHRLNQPVPDSGTLLQQLQAYGSESSAAAPLQPSAASLASSERTDRMDSAQARGLLPWRGVFSPSPGLDQRGININSVRARLLAIGEILRAVPSILPGGGMTFEFSLALRETPTDLAAWETDGVLLQPAEPAAPADSAFEPDGGAAAPNLFIAPSHIVRVDLSRLDDLMRITGEMVIHRSRLEERIAQLTGDRSALQEVNLGLGRSLRELREAITRVRLVPVAEIFTRMPFVVRDLARDTGKRVRLALEGQHTEIDKFLVERLKEPLLHLVRNAVSHGVESPEARIASGKPAEATLLLRAFTAGQSVVIQIRDDGRGIDGPAVARRAAAAGIAVSRAPDEHELIALLCRPGFSTRAEADRASGRGVGMAVVHSAVHELGGSLSLETEPGQWTQFTLRLPLTLSIAEIFLVSAAGHACAVPQGYVEEIVQIAEAKVRTINQAEVIPYRDGLLPLVRLRTLFGADPSGSAEVPVLVLGSERGLSGLVVDRVHGQREVVVRAIQDPLIQVPGISGATELGDGRPVLILDAAMLAQGVVRPRAHSAAGRSAAPAQQKVS
ncbi:MAG TPA: chemotaxis protein CheA [Opitutaceae bacterium]|nr:chemotaxis protein CheA [Opitutaceae bacterium]